MTINVHDDYEKLVKLLYPSIEASGNVYYGQTRKLTTDEILGKNLLNFESHIETFNKGVYGYKSYFNWRLGPLSGSVQVVPIDNNLDCRIEGYQLPTAVDPMIRDSVIRLYKDGTSANLEVADDPAVYIDGTIFVKYRLNVSSKAVEQLTNSGSFPVYENNVEPVFECFVVTDWFDPSNVDGFNIYDIKDRNFFVEYKNGECYLYIQLMSDEVQSPNVKIDLNQPMTFTALQANSQVKFRWNDASSYEINQYNGYGWVSIPDNDHTVVLQNEGDKVSIRYFDVVNNTTSNPRFYLTGSVKASGNICSLLSNLYGEANSRIDFTAYNLKFSYMFQNQTALTDVSELYMYIQRASSSCCAYMFDGCTYIAYPPKLTIEYAASNCFEAMFSNCTRLKYAPELIATDLANSCYYMMFAGCTSLNNAPYLPATTMYQNCYDSMFSGCTNLKYAMAILPAKNLNAYCYNSMFSSCVNLRTAPVLPATSTPRDCYSYMFSGCSELSYVCCLADNLNPSYPPTITNWLNDVADTGKLLVLSNAPQHLVDSLPTGWQLVRLTEGDVSDINNIEVRHPGIGFNCRLSDSEEPNKYFYVATSGADSVNNGRGKLDDDTTFNMLSTNPVLSDTEYDTCDLNTGNANQEIWGYKCFNSPVSFRNGIYGECASLITSNPNDEGLNVRLDASLSHGIVDNLRPKYSYGSKLICKAVEEGYLDSPLSTVAGKYDPCAAVEVYQSDAKEANYNNDSYGNYKACVSQSSIIASNKYSDIVSANKYIDTNAVYNNTNKPQSTAAFIASASACPVINTQSAVLGYSEEYKALITAGDASITLNNISYPDSGNSCQISIESDDVSVNSNVSLHDNTLGVYFTDGADVQHEEHTLLTMGNTKNDYSGCLTYKSDALYTYDSLAAEYTYPMDVTNKLSSVLKDDQGAIAAEGHITFEQHLSTNDSFIKIGMDAGSNCAILLNNNTEVSGSLKVWDDNASDYVFELNGSHTNIKTDVAIKGELDVKNANDSSVVLVTTDPAALCVYGDIMATQDVYIDGDLTVRGQLISEDQATSLHVSGDLTVDGDASIHNCTFELTQGAFEVTSPSGYDLVLNSGASDIDIQGTKIYLSAPNTYITGTLNVSGSSIILNGATITGSASSINVNKTFNVTGSITSTEQCIVGTRLVVGTATYHPYYLISYQNELHIGDTINGSDVNGGTVKVNTLDASEVSAGIVANSLQFATPNEPLDSSTYPMIHQTDAGAAEIPIGAIFFARVTSTTSIYAGAIIPRGSNIQMIDLCMLNWNLPSATGIGGRVLNLLELRNNSLYITTVDHGGHQAGVYRTFTPITCSYDSLDGQGLIYQNLAIVMRVQ